MAKAFKCDQCGKLQEHGPVAILTLVPPTGNFYMYNMKIAEQHESELCSDCLHSLTKTKPL